MKIPDTLKSAFNGYVSLNERRPGIFQLQAPLYHEDGDMIDIYLEKTSDNQIRVSDHGMTLMRLSYTFEIDTENKQRIFNEILSRNQVENESGRLSVVASEETIVPAILHFAQTVGKVSNLTCLKREIVSGLFYEMLQDFVENELSIFRPQRNFCPIPSRDDLEVDFAFDIRPQPVYLFAVRNNSQARLAAISCLEFQRSQLRFKGYVVHDSFNALTAKDRCRITSAADKQFPSLEDFKANAALFLGRETEQANPH